MNFSAKNIAAAVLLALLAAAALHPEYAAAASSTLKIGISEEPKSINVFKATDANSNKVMSLFYQPLYTPDPETLQPTPWLAESMPEWDPEENTYTVKLREAKWEDGSDLTADDVVFTVETILEFKVPKYYSDWEVVSKVEAVDDRTVRFHLKEPRATFTTRTLINYIVPEKQWGPIVKQAKKQDDPLSELLNARIDEPLGCGPFVLEKWDKGNYLYLSGNENFFGKGLNINGRKLGPHMDAVMFKVYGTSDVAVLALKKKKVDFLWWSIQPGYIKELERADGVKVFVNDKSALYYMGFNVRKKPFSDPAFRRAAAFVIDKGFIVDRILQGYASEMDSIIPAQNKYWHADNLPDYGSGLDREERIKKAVAILKKAGYTWIKPPVDESGDVVKPSRILGPDGRTMEKFTILTPPADYDPNRATCGVMAQEWLNALGIPASSRPMSFSAMLEKVKNEHDFDTFILGYGRLSLDPDYLTSFFHSDNDESGGWNMSGYSNEDFDRIAALSGSEMDREKRRDLVRRMQRIAMRDVPYIPLYNPSAVEPAAVDRFSGWQQMVGGIGNIWSFCQVKPE